MSQAKEMFLRKLRYFRRDEKGSMTMEFAIVAPLLFIIIIAGFEFFDAFKSHGRAAKVTYSVADILSRQVEVDEPYITELHSLMNALLPWMNGDKSLTVSSVSFDKDNGYQCEWSKHSDTNMTMNFNLTLNGAVLKTQEYQDVLPEIASGDSIILVETVIPHRTLFSIFGLKDLVWYNQIAIRPRFISALADTTANAPKCT